MAAGTYERTQLAFQATRAENLFDALREKALQVLRNKRAL